MEKRGMQMDRCARCGLPEMSELAYGSFVGLLYDLYIAVKNSKKTGNETTRFLAQVEIEFLLQELSDLDQLSDH